MYSIQQSEADFLLSSYRYELPPERIAQHPGERGASRLLVLDRETGKRIHSHFSHLLEYLPKGTLLIANNSRVVPARMIGQRPSGGKRDHIDPYGEKEWLNLSISRRRKRRGRRIPTGYLCCALRASAPFAPVESIVSSYIFGNFKNFRSNGRCFGDRREKMGRRKGRRRPSWKTRKPLRPRRFGG